MSALFTSGNLLNMATETIKRRLWTEVRLVLCFISDLKFFEQVTVTSCSFVIKFNTISEKILKTYWFDQSRSINAVDVVDELTLICFMSWSVQKCKFFKTASNISQLSLVRQFECLAFGRYSLWAQIFFFRVSCLFYASRITICYLGRKYGCISLKKLSILWQVHEVRIFNCLHRSWERLQFWYHTYFPFCS